MPGCQCSQCYEVSLHYSDHSLRRHNGFASVVHGPEATDKFTNKIDDHAHARSRLHLGGERERQSFSRDQRLNSACIATIIRLPFLIKISHEHSLVHDGPLITIVSCLETGLSIIALSAATLKPLFRRKSENGTNKSTPTPALKQPSIESSYPSSGGGEHDIESSTAFYNTRSTIQQSYGEASVSLEHKETP